MKKQILSICGVAAIGFFALNVLGQSFVSPYKMRLRTFLTGLSNPILIRNAKDGSKRLFIVQQSGLIKVLQPGSTVPATFINLTSKILFAGDERGLLGMTFHPSFSSNGKFYVYYNRSSDGAITISEFRVTGDPNQGDVTTERILLIIPHSAAPNHNGGMIEFGPDGYLYMGTGDGGSGNDPPNNAQNRAMLLGKMLRIDVNVPNGSPNPYLIPPTNPFVGANTTRCDGGSTTAGNTCQEIWAIGMRNPWRWSFDRGGTNQMWVGDVGQDAIEEIDNITGGANYGWRVYEGDRCTNNDPGLCTNPNPYTLPVFEYSSANPDPRCAITGGYVYRGTQGSVPFGAYVFGDYCTGEIWTLQNGIRTAIGGTRQFLTSFGEDEDGELYVCYQNGEIDKITRAKAAADFDGDAKTDFSVYRPVGGLWIINNSTGGLQVSEWGSPSSIPVPGDYDGDNITDFAVFHPPSGLWYILRSTDGTVAIQQFGGNPSAVPVPGDYDGDSKTDVALFAGGLWYILRSSDSHMNVFEWGSSTDHPVPGDYDGDGKTDTCVFREGVGWFSRNSSDGKVRYREWGVAGDVGAPGDFDGDGRTDIAVFRPSTGVWFILKSSNNSVSVVEWGSSIAKPEVGDYDGDGKDDITVWNPGQFWYVLRSSDGLVTVLEWGVNTDIPIPALDSR